MTHHTPTKVLTSTQERSDVGTLGPAPSPQNLEEADAPKDGDHTEDRGDGSERQGQREKHQGILHAARHPEKQPPFHFVGRAHTQSRDALPPSSKPAMDRVSSGGEA